MSNPPREQRSITDWQGTKLALGESSDVHLVLSESYSGMVVRIPVHIRRAAVEGPTVFVTAALHGDEINGTGAIRQMIHQELQLIRGSIVLVPVMNILGFDRHSRYLPDRRDLNRAFPGSAKGSLASRMARTLFDEIVCRCDCGIDLHTAAVRRTNYPNVRADLSDPKVAELAQAFGCEVIMNGRGPRGSLRREASKHGCPTIVMEGGEVSKVEPAIVKTAVRGVKNLLAHLKMIEDEPELPANQVTIEKSKWVRADRGGFLRFHVSPGDIVEEGQAIATNTTLLGREQSVIYAPFHSVVVGMTTVPATSPGEPICNLGRLPKSMRPAEYRRLRLEEDGLEERLVDDLASNLIVVEASDMDQED